MFLELQPIKNHDFSQRKHCLKLISSIRLLTKLESFLQGFVAPLSQIIYFQLYNTHECNIVANFEFYFT